MNEKEILDSELSKAEKARRLFDLGKTRREVADLVLGSNVGWAYNIEKDYKEKKAAKSEQKLPEAQQPLSSEQKLPEPLAKSAALGSAPQEASAEKPAVPVKTPGAAQSGEQPPGAQQLVSSEQKQPELVAKSAALGSPPQEASAKKPAVPAKTPGTTKAVLKPEPKAGTKAVKKVPTASKVKPGSKPKPKAKKGLRR